MDFCLLIAFAIAAIGVIFALATAVSVIRKGIDKYALILAVISSFFIFALAYGVVDISRGTLSAKFQESACGRTAVQETACAANEALKIFLAVSPGRQNDARKIETLIANRGILVSMGEDDLSFYRVTPDDPRPGTNRIIADICGESFVRSQQVFTLFKELGFTIDFDPKIRTKKMIKGNVQVLLF